MSIYLRILQPATAAPRLASRGQRGLLRCAVLVRVVPKGAAFPRPAAWAGSLATIGNGQHHGDALEVDLGVAHPQTKGANVAMTGGLEAETETEGERGLGAGIKDDLGPETGSV